MLENGRSRGVPRSEPASFGGSELAPPLRTQGEPEKEICFREDKPNSSINQNSKKHQIIKLAKNTSYYISAEVQFKIIKEK